MAAKDRRQEMIEKEQNKAGLRGKINAKCIECIYDEHGGDGNWRHQVAACTAPKCPLYPIRPTVTTG